LTSSVSHSRKGREGEGIPGGRGGDDGAEGETGEQRAAAAVELGRGKTRVLGLEQHFLYWGGVGSGWLVKRALSGPPACRATLAAQERPDAPCRAQILVEFANRTQTIVVDRLLVETQQDAHG
jgi:hypothetical protein